MKRIFSLLLAALLVVTMMPGVRAVAADVEVPTRQTRPDTSHWTQIQPRSDDYYVNEWEAVAKLADALERWPDEYTIHVATYYEDYEQLVYDIFYAATDHTGVPTQGDYLFYQIYDFGYGWEGMNYGSYTDLDITYYFSYLTDADEQAQVDTAVSSILSGMDLDGKSDYEKVRSIYEYMTNWITPVDDIGCSLNDMTAYGALVKQQAASSGMAVAFYRLALELGIDCRVVYGTKDGQPHYWNIVELDEYFYNVDAHQDAEYTAAGGAWLRFLKCNASFEGYTLDDYFNDSYFLMYFPMSSSDFQTSGDEHVHSYSEVVTPPTCTAQGYTLYTCYCGYEVIGSYTEKLPHEWQDAEVILAPTATADGKMRQVCQVCDTQRTQRIRSESLTQALAYERMMELQADYPTGTFYDNSVGYAWKGGIFSVGYGCAGFAFMLSDAAFDDLPARIIDEDISIDMLRVGDILRVYGDTHSVIVMEIFEDYIVLAEGNFNSATYWGRTMTAQEIIRDTDYVMTRYPEDWTEESEETFATGDVNHDGYVDGADAMLLRQFVARWKLETFFPENADIDASGVIDGADAMLLRQLIAG